MISVIVSTNRPKSKSAQVAKEIAHQLNKQTNEAIKICSLLEVSYSGLTVEMYDNPPLGIKNFAIDNLINSEKLLFVIPEYNGSFPGVLKLIIDLASVIDFKGVFTNKEVLLIGVSEGKAGNLLGMAHFGSIVQYMGGCLSTKNLPIPCVSKMFNNDSSLNEATKKAIQYQLKNWRGL